MSYKTCSLPRCCLRKLWGLTSNHIWTPLEFFSLNLTWFPLRLLDDSHCLPGAESDLQGSQRTKKPQSEGIQGAFGWGGGVCVCVSKCMKVQKMPFFTSFFTLRAGVIHSCLTRSWSLSVAEDQEVHDSTSIFFTRHNYVQRGVICVQAVSDSPFIFCHWYWRSWQESRFVKIQLRPSSLTTEGEKLGWKTSTPLNHSSPCVAEGDLLQEKRLSFNWEKNKQKKSQTSFIINIITGERHELLTFPFISPIKSMRLHTFPPILEGAQYSERPSAWSWLQTPQN